MSQTMLDDRIINGSGVKITLINCVEIVCFGAHKLEY